MQSVNSTSPPEKPIFIRGRTAGTINLVLQGFRYGKDGKPTQDGRQAWRCVLRKDKCPGRLYTTGASEFPLSSLSLSSGGQLLLPLLPGSPEMGAGERAQEVLRRWNQQPPYQFLDSCGYGDSCSFGTALQSYFRPSPLYSPTLNSPPLNSPTAFKSV